MADNNRQPPVIFLAFANDRSDSTRYLRNLPEEARRLKEALKPAEREGLCEVVSESNVTLDVVLDTFQAPEYRNRIAVFHFAGHANGYKLLLETTDGAPAIADAGGFAQFLGQQRGLQLVFLNGCSTRRQVKGLLNANVATVVATAHDIYDDVARDFASRFYKGLAAGADIDTAFKQAEGAVQTGAGDAVRHVKVQGQDAPAPVDRVPWQLYVKDGAEIAGEWDLPTAVGDPLFGLPDLPEMDLPASPFRHLNWFERKHAHVFFGRGEQIRELYTRVTGPRAAPITLFYGQSGVGKSSLLAAGLLPRLEADYQVRYVRRRRNAGALGTLRAVLDVAADETTLTEAWLALEEEGEVGGPLIVVLDQLEEVFTKPRGERPATELNRLLENLGDVFADPSRRPEGKLVLSFRKEWLAEIETHLREYKLPRSKVFLERLDRAGIMEAVAGVARDEELQQHYGLTVEEGLPGIIADDLMEDPDSPVAPTLQILLTKMWNEATERNYSSPRFDIKLYQGLRREGILLEDFLDQQLAELRRRRESVLEQQEELSERDDQRKGLLAERWASFRRQQEEILGQKTDMQERGDDVVDSGLALDVLAYHTTPLGTADQRSTEELPKTYSHISEILEWVIQQLKNLYLLVGSSKDGQENPISRLAHDALAPLVRERYEESDHAGQRARRILEMRAIEWRDGQKGRPLDEQDLALVERGAAGMRAWTSDEQRLVDASRQEQKKRERVRRLRRIAIAAVPLMLIAILGVTALIENRNAAVQAQAAATQAAARVAAEQSAAVAATARAETEKALLEAEREARRAKAGELAARARGVLDSDVDPSGSLPLLLAIEAVSTTLRADEPPVREASLALVETVQRVPPWRMTINAHQEGVESVEYRPDGRSIVTAGCDERNDDYTCTAGSARVWDASTGKQLLTFAEQQDLVVSAVYSPNGRRIFTITDDGVLELWDATDGTLETTYSEEQRAITSADFSPDGAHIATVAEGGIVRVWRVTGGGPALTLIENGEPVYAVDYSPDGAHIATASDDGTVQIWNATSGEPLSTLGDRDGIRVESAVYSPDGEHIAMTGGIWEVQIWNVGTGKLVHTLEGHRHQIGSLAYSPDGTHLVSTSPDETARVWDVVEGTLVSTLTGHASTTLSAAYSPDGTTVATAGIDGTVRLWDVARGNSLLSLNAHPGGSTSARYTDDGSMLITTGCEEQDERFNCIMGSTRIWDATSGDVLLHLDEFAEEVTAAAYHAETERIVTGDLGGAVQIWNARDGSPVLRLRGHSEKVTTADYTPDGTRIVTAGRDGMARVWDAISGAPLQEFGTEGWRINSAAYSPDGRFLVVAGSGIARILDATTGETLQSIEGGQAETMKRAVFSPDSTKIVTIGEFGQETIRVWDVKSGKNIKTLEGQEGEVNWVSYSPDGSRIASVGCDNWVTNGEKLGCGATSARIWDASTAELLLRTSYDDYLWSAEFNNDGTKLVTAGNDGAVRVWPATVDGWLEIAEQRIQREPPRFTNEERQQFGLADG